MGGTPYPSVPVEKLYPLLLTQYRMDPPAYSTPEMWEGCLFGVFVGFVLMGCFWVFGMFLVFLRIFR